MVQLELTIDFQVSNLEEVEKLLKKVVEIQKEHRCNCTLSVTNKIYSNSTYNISPPEIDTVLFPIKA